MWREEDAGSDRAGSRLDAWFARGARGLARRTSRRHFLTRLGALLVGGAAWPLLPVARPARAAPGEPDPSLPEGDATSCEYWRYCAIDGFLSSCCGGTATSCPPGTGMSPVTWLGTCRNPADGRDYVISYNDCCGKDLCGRCVCMRQEGDHPVYVPSRSNDINWCMGREGIVYNSTVAVVVGVADEG
jgi:methylamine dehydrogenase light chain